MNEVSYKVSGMSCAHCADAITRSLNALPGIDAVAVDIATGTVRVSGSGSAEDIRAAVAEAGYEVVHA
ncbi:heavy-metal-associated domain-containing protein [Nocardia flavorosea]|uniref:Heavy-metal-associated domain-containing protein n=2 Tax=Nocardia flavorosea TaxID=53429 RepID=A0A846YJE2_9NOCA|nr:heavy-metal-associated domain-containing protein [Nocardia flavorosea]